MHRADAGTGQHGNRQFRNQRQIQCDAIAAFDAETFQDVGKLAHLPVEIEVREGSPVARLALPDDRRLIAPEAADMPIDAVDARVQRAADEPLRVRRLPVEHLAPRCGPFELGCEVGPEPFGIRVGAGVNRFVADVGFGPERRLGLERAIFLEQVGYVGKRLLIGHDGDLRIDESTD